MPLPEMISFSSCTWNFHGKWTQFYLDYSFKMHTYCFSQSCEIGSSHHQEQMGTEKNKTPRGFIIPKENMSYMYINHTRLSIHFSFFLFFFFLIWNTVSTVLIFKKFTVSLGVGNANGWFHLGYTKKQTLTSRDLNVVRWKSELCTL